MSRISVYILTYNEEEKIEEAIQTVTWADEIVIIDSFSTDSTVEICRRYTDKIVQLEFEGFGKLRIDALANTSFGWIFSLDADERCTPEAADEIKRIISGSDSADAYYVPRRNYFMGRWIKHSGWYPDYRQPQLFRRGAVEYHDDMVHEGYTVHGSVGYLKSDIWQFPYRDLSQLIDKMQNYTTLGAQKLADKGRKSGMGSAFIHGSWAFVRTYFFKLGILDGWPGFIIALSGFEGTFYRYAKLAERERNKDPHRKDRS